MKNKELQRLALPPFDRKIKNMDSSLEKSEISFECINSVILDNEYVKNTKSNKKKDVSSLSYLVNKSLSQSDCIRLGNGAEKVISDLVLKFTNLINIKPKNSKGKKERDHLFVDEVNKVIYYAELKSNINLDTEKSKSTYNKCLVIAQELQEQYPDYQIKWCLLALRYLTFDDIQPIIKKKYEPIQNNVFGVNQYLDMLNIEFKFTAQQYAEFINTLADNMFD